MDLVLPLKDLVANVPGAAGAVLIDNEGEAITYFSHKGNDENERIRLIGAYHRIWLTDSQAITQRRHLGTLDQLIQRYDGGTVIIKALKDNYALVLLGCGEKFFLGQAIRRLNEVAALISEDL